MANGLKLGEKVHELRESGKTYTEIGKMLSVTNSWARECEHRFLYHTERLNNDGVYKLLYDVKELHKPIQDSTIKFVWSVLDDYKVRTVEDLQEVSLNDFMNSDYVGLTVIAIISLAQELSKKSSS